MRSRRLVVVEITILVATLLLVVAIVEIVPFLNPSKQRDSIGLYQEREYAKGNVTLASGEWSSVRFTYTSYDPAILTLDIAFLTWKSPGYLILRCNNRVFASVLVQPENSSLSFTIISVSGREWIEPPSSMFGVNEITFESDPNNGYEGTFSYRISVRGSR